MVFVLIPSACLLKGCSMVGSLSGFISRATLRWLSFRWFFREISFVDIHKVDDRRCCIPPRHFLMMEARFFGFLRSSVLIENVIDIVPQFGVGWLPGINVISQTITDGYVPYPKSVLLTRRLLSPFVPPLRFPSNRRRINIQC